MTKKILSMSVFKILFFVFFLLLIPLFTSADVSAGDKKFTISGRITDKRSGETLPGATVYVAELQTGAVSNSYGYYALNLPPGNYKFTFSYVGYHSQVSVLQLAADTTLDVEMISAEEMLDEVVVFGVRDDHNVRTPAMSVERVESKTIRQIPALFGEVDVIRAMQLLPGVKAISEGSVGFSVRGGSADQNLVLLDEATVYNAGHLLGFFSVFNNDAVKDVTMYKGDIPASQGGRLSSLMDVRMKDGNHKKFSVTGGIGLISSRLTLEGPIVSEKTSFILSGRRTYADIFLPLSKNENIRDSRLFFYDLNAKINHIFDEKNRIFLSAYLGRDVFKNDFAGMNLGNKTISLRWNHLFSKKVFSNFTLLGSRYDYQLGIPEGEPMSFDWISGLMDYAAKADFTFYAGSRHTLRFGIHSTYHTFSPGEAKGKGEESFFNDYILPESHALESALYFSDQYQVNEALTLKYGLRLSGFHNVGPGTVYTFDENFESTDSVFYDKGNFFNSFINLEPRFGVNYLLNEQSSIKASYSRTVQYLHLAQNSTAGTPLDIWFPSSPNVKPQLSDQVAIGYFRNFDNNTWEISAELYYKNMENAIDFKDHAYLLLNRELEGELRFGKAWSKGAELMVRKVKGNFTGWISYTYSGAERKFAAINNGKTFAAPYDKPHDISVVVNYNVNGQLSVGANWVYSTGRPVTFPVGRAVWGNVIVPVYSDRNAYRLPDYHRLDLSFTYKPKQHHQKKWYGEWNLSVYNAYARKNVWAINFVSEPDDPYSTYAESTYLFSIIPSLTYNFHF